MIRALPLALAALAATPVLADTPPTMASLLAGTQPSDWRKPDPQDTLYLELPAGRVVIELNSTFAPRHAANIRSLARAGWYDGLAVLRSQDNYVVQWGDPHAGDAERARPIGDAERNLAPEFSVRLGLEQPFTRLPDGDVYAPEVGFLHGFAVARDPARQQAWLAHCYGTVGVSRDNAADSGDGSGLYVVIGHSPRHLDRNVTVVGRVLLGMEHLSTLERGDGPLGFYADPARQVPIGRLRLASELEPAERTPLEVLRTETTTFVRLIESRRNRREEWFLHPTGRVELCNVPVPVRPAAPDANEAADAEADADADDAADDSAGTDEGAESGGGPEAAADPVEPSAASA
jgi:peptidylprolyl isomerase